MYYHKNNMHFQKDIFINTIKKIKKNKTKYFFS